MQFNGLLGLLGLATLAIANSVTFVSQDHVDRTVVFTPNAGLEWLPDVRVPAFGEVTVGFPQGWIGNWWSVSDGAARAPGMLGEVAFNGWNGLTYFDVSAIVNPNDHHGVKEMYPKSNYHPVSGCKLFPCQNAYYLPDDIQTKATLQTDLICTLGSDANAKREEVAEEDSAEERFPRIMVTTGN